MQVGIQQEANIYVGWFNKTSFEYLSNKVFVLAWSQTGAESTRVSDCCCLTVARCVLEIQRWSN